MTNPTHALLVKCRFCLSEDGLMPMSKALNFEFTVQDLEWFTGIQITEDEQLYCAICDTCCQILKSTVELRITSLRNEETFKFIFAAFIESLEGDPIATKIALVSDAIPKTQTNTLVPKCTQKEDIDHKTNQSSRYSLSLENNQNVTREKNETVTINDKSLGKRRELCNICGKLVFSFKEHSVTHTTEQNFTCPYCPKKFVKKRYLKLHVQSFHERKVVRSCEKCGEEFTHRNSYTIHMVSKHGIGKKYECKICFKTYNRACHYTDHFNKTHGNQEYPCAECGRIFKSKNQLKGHESVHSDDQPYACSQCPKRFKKLKARKTHELTHTGIRFSCKLCEKSYGYKALLSAHYRKDHEGMIPSETDNVSLNS